MPKARRRRESVPNETGAVEPAWLWAGVVVGTEALCPEPHADPPQDHRGDIGGAESIVDIGDGDIW